MYLEEYSTSKFYVLSQCGDIIPNGSDLLRSGSISSINPASDGPVCIRHPNFFVSVSANCLAPDGALPTASTVLTTKLCFFIVSLIMLILHNINEPEKSIKMTVEISRNLALLPILINWGWVMHICVSKLTIIGSDNGLAPDRRQAIIWINAGLLLIGSLGTNFSEIWSKF